MIESIVQCLNKVHIAHILICIQNLAYIHILRPRTRKGNQFSMFDAFSGADSKNRAIYQRKIRNIPINSIICHHFCSECWFQRDIICRDMHFQVFFVLQNDSFYLLAGIFPIKHETLDVQNMKSSIQGFTEIDLTLD